LEKVIIDGEEFYKLTDEEKKHCLALIRDNAQPSDFGYGFIEAGFLIGCFLLTLKKTLADVGIPEEFKSRTEELFIRGEMLSHAFVEAGKLAGEEEQAS
jgi:hypothetical protein